MPVQYFPVSVVVPAILEIYQQLLGVQFGSQGRHGILVGLLLWCDELDVDTALVFRR
jgi:hypothetical protein